MNSVDLKFEEINVGDRASFFHKIMEKDVNTFAALLGDYNPLHMDPEYAKTTLFGQQIVHGMFLASLFSRLVGMYLPGRRCLYLSQSLDFVNPAFVGDEVEVIGVIQRKQTATNTLVLQTTIDSVEKNIIRGKAHVKVLD